MPRVKGPLFSATAKGSIGDALTYQEGYGGARVGSVPRHRDRQTAAQLGQRRRFSEAKWLWRGMDAATKADYEGLGAAKRMTGWQYWLRVFLSGELYADAGLYLPMHEGDGVIAHDFSKYGVNGGITGGVWHRAPSGPPLLSLDGTDDYVEVTGDTSHLNITAEPFSIVVRLRISAPLAGGIIYCRGLQSTDGYVLYYNSLGVIFFQTSQSGAFQQTRSSAGSIVTGTWLTVGISRKGASAGIYVNGVAKTQFPVAHTNPATSSRTIKVGIYDNKVSSPVKGRIASLLVVDRSLTEQEHLAWHKLLSCEG